MNKNEEEALSQWIDENQPRIRVAFIKAAMRIDAISEAQTDRGVTENEYVSQKISGIITSSRSVLREFLTEEVAAEFTDVGDHLRASLQTNVPRVVEEHMQEYVDVLVLHIMQDK